MAATELGDALVVVAHGARFALPMHRVAEVRAYARETPVPGAPAAIRGIVEREGAPVHLLDLSRRLFGSPAEAGERACIVFLHHVAGHGAVAMMVDDVERIVERPTAAAEQPSAFACVAGAIDDAEGALPLLDVDGLFETIGGERR